MWTMQHHFGDSQTHGEKVHGTGAMEPVQGVRHPRDTFPRAYSSL